MALSDTFVRQVKYTGAAAGDKHIDGDSLYLLVTGAGKYWRMNYRFGGKQKTLALGVYPAISLVAARRRRDDARVQLANGIDPGAARKAAKAEAKRAAGAAFEIVAREWLLTSATERGDETQKRVVSWFERDIFPYIGTRNVGELTPPDILELMKRMEKRGIIDSMRRVLGYISRVFRLAMVQQLTDRDPTVGIADQLKQRNEGHFAAITEPVQLGGLLRSIYGYQGHPSVCAALKIMPAVFQRPHMIREALWSEIDLDTATWCIPAEKMKMENDHIVPLATQVVAILRQLHEITAKEGFVFGGIRQGRPMSENAINSALRNMGYMGDVMTGHGFRATARTILDEVLEERVDLIEHQLAHAVNDVNGRAYNRTSHLRQRREMMQRWADYLDKLRAGADIVPLLRAV